MGSPFVPSHQGLEDAGRVEAQLFGGLHPVAFGARIVPVLQLREGDAARFQK